MQEDNGVTYADPNIANGKGLYEIEMQGAGKWIVSFCTSTK